MLSIRSLVALAAFAAPLLAASAPRACPTGVAGIADPGALVCAESLHEPSGQNLYCDYADAAGRFRITGPVVPPSTGPSCLPGGEFHFYEPACPYFVTQFDRGAPGHQSGGDWLDIRCPRAVEVDESNSRSRWSCVDGSYCDERACDEPEAPISLMMCGCGYLDPACGVGACEEGAYIEGRACGEPMVYPVEDVVSRALCAMEPIAPDTCEIR